MKPVRIILIIMVFTILLLPGAAMATDVKFDHLERLRFTFRTDDGRQMACWAIYGGPDKNGRFRQVEAPGEGFGCVDDVARIALVYLADYHKTGSALSRRRSVEALEFLLYMENGKGDYFNFVDRAGKINKNGITSRIGLDWWTARAFRALGRGIQTLGPEDQKLAGRMKAAYNRTLELLEQNLKDKTANPVIREEYQKRNLLPGQLVSDSGAITSIFLLGLSEAHPGLEPPRVRRLAKAYGKALCSMEVTGSGSFPLTGFHVPTVWNPHMVHLYGNRQVEALALAGKVLGRPQWIKSARREADRGYRVIYKYWNLPFALSPGPEESPQIAYSVETVISNLLALYKATGDVRYRHQASDFGGWLFGDNLAGKPLYNPATGACFDGVDTCRINRNAGAESTLEALMALQGLEENVPQKSRNYRQALYRKRPPSVIPLGRPIAPRGPVTTITRKYTGGTSRKITRLKAGGRFHVTSALPRGNYRLFLVYRVMEKTPPNLSIIIGQTRLKPALVKSREDYIYRTIPLGIKPITMKPGEIISFSLSKKKGEVILDSILAVKSCDVPGNDNTAR